MQRSDARPSKLGEPAPRVEHCLLERVLSVLHRPEDPVGMELELLTIGAGEFAERLLVPPGRAR